MGNYEKTLKNSIISVLAQGATLLLSFVNRKVFAIFLDIELLGYQSLFSNIFSILSVAELGVGNIISINLYKELVNKNDAEIGKLMYLYKRIYSYIGIFILSAGIIIYPFLPYIMKNSYISKADLFIIYFMQLGSIFLDYFLSYKRTIYIADQKEYICASIDLGTKAIVQVVQIITLVLFKNYILYLCIQFGSNIIANYIIYKKSKKDYPYTNTKYLVSKQYIEQRKFIPELKNFLIHKIAFALYGSTDNIIISAILGVRYVALYGNYYMLFSGIITLLFYKLLNPLQSTIGKIVNSNRSKDEIWEQFQVFETANYFLSCLIGIGFLCLFQPTIEIWMGKEFLLSTSFVILFSFTAYMDAVLEMLYKYRSVFGEFDRDRNSMVIGALINVIISLIMAPRLGLVGIQLGTIVGYLAIAYGRIKFVIKCYFQKNIFEYIFNQIKMMFLALAEGTVCYLLTFFLESNVVGIIIRFIVILIIPQVINYLIFRKTKTMKSVVLYAKRTIKLVYRREFLK